MWLSLATDRRLLTGVARARQRRHFLVEQLLDVHQPQRDQGPDQLHLGIDVQLGIVLPVDDVEPNVRTFLRFLTGRRTLLILAPLSRGVMAVFATSSHHRGWSRFNFQLSFAHP